MTQDFDPKLKEALAKIEAITKEYDCAYLVVLSSKTHTEYKTDFPAWSLIQYNESQAGIQVKTDSKNPELTDSSFHLLYSIRDVAGLIFMRLQQTAEQIETMVKVKHNPFGRKNMF